MQMQEVSEEKAHKVGQSLCQLYTSQGINFQITLKSQKNKAIKDTNNQIFKMCYGSEQRIL